MIILHTMADDITVEQGEFPDGTLMMHLPEENVHSISWYYDNDAELFTLMCIVRHYQKYMPMPLYLPYVPHARQDRVKNPTDVFTLKYFCEIINSLGFEKVRVFDVHSNVSLALLNNVEHITAAWFIDSVLEKLKDENPVLFFPDEGAMKRYSGEYQNAEFTYGNKKRNWETGKIDKLTIVDPDMVKDRNILIIDDICSYGGTFHRAAKALKEAGVKNIYLYITHAENNMVKGDMYLNDDIKHIYTTSFLFDTLNDQLNKVTIVN